MIKPKCKDIRNWNVWKFEISAEHVSGFLVSNKHTVSGFEIKLQVEETQLTRPSPSGFTEAGMIISFVSQNNTLKVQERPEGSVSSPGPISSLVLYLTHLPHTDLTFAPESLQSYLQVSKLMVTDNLELQPSGRGDISASSYFIKYLILGSK